MLGKKTYLGWFATSPIVEWGLKDVGENNFRAEPAYFVPHQGALLLTICGKLRGVLLYPLIYCRIYLFKPLFLQQIFFKKLFSLLLIHLVPLWEGLRKPSLRPKHYKVPACIYIYIKRHANLCRCYRQMFQDLHILVHFFRWHINWEEDTLAPDTSITSFTLLQWQLIIALRKANKSKLFFKKKVAITIRGENFLIYVQILQEWK